MLHEIDHIGIAVQDLDATIKQYQRDFSGQVCHREILKESKVELAFIKCPNTMLELLASTDPSSTLAPFLEKRGPGLHHICYRVPNIHDELQRLKKLGHELIDHKPRPGAHNTQIAFVHPKTMGGVLVELCQYPTE